MFDSIDFWTFFFKSTIKNKKKGNVSVISQVRRPKRSEVLFSYGCEKSTPNMICTSPRRSRPTVNVCGKMTITAYGLRLILTIVMVSWPVSDSSRFNSKTVSYRTRPGVGRIRGNELKKRKPFAPTPRGLASSFYSC